MPNYLNQRTRHKDICDFPAKISQFSFIISLLRFKSNWRASIYDLENSFQRIEKASQMPKESLCSNYQN